MNVSRPEYLPDPELSKEEMKQMQREIGREAIFEDQINFDSLEGQIVAGVDQAFLEERAISAVVLMKDGEVIERTHAVTDLEIPYIPGLLAFREGEPIVKALEKLENEPDVLFLDGSGRIHFREAGIATHIGVIFDTPSIGIAKKLLCGEPVGDISDLDEGERIRIMADSSVETSGNELIGYAYQSRQYDKGGINPLYVSSGHRISASTAVDFVAETCEKYKLPEPTRLADRYVDEIKQTL